MEQVKNFIQKDRVVFVLKEDSQNRNTNSSTSTTKYVTKMIDIMLSKQGVTSEKIFIGGSKLQLELFISGILEFYHYKEVEILDISDEFLDDPDFLC